MQDALDDTLMVDSRGLHELWDLIDGEGRIWSGDSGILESANYASVETWIFKRSTIFIKKGRIGCHMGRARLSILHVSSVEDLS
jgi:hypothetical protein